MATISDFEGLAEAELHDAIITQVQFDAPAKRCKVALSIHEDHASHRRVNAVLEFEGVSAGTCNLDMISLFDNALSGNVMTCRVDVDRKIVRLYLSDGIIEVWSESVSLSLA